MYKTKDTSISFAFINTNREEDFLFPKCDLERYRFLWFVVVVHRNNFFQIHHPRCCQIPKSVLPSYWPALYENILKVTPVDSYNIPGMRGSASTAGLDLRPAQL